MNDEPNEVPCSCSGTNDRCFRCDGSGYYRATPGAGDVSDLYGHKRGKTRADRRETTSLSAKPTRPTPEKQAAKTIPTCKPITPRVRKAEELETYRLADAMAAARRRVLAISKSAELLARELESSRRCRKTTSALLFPWRGCRLPDCSATNSLTRRAEDAVSSFRAVARNAAARTG